jgi:hypothetical protein
MQFFGGDELWDLAPWGRLEENQAAIVSVMLKAAFQFVLELKKILNHELELFFFREQILTIFLYVMESIR